MDDDSGEARRAERFKGEKRRQVVTACAPCRISHRCCDEPRPCKRCKRLGLICLPGETPLTEELIAEDRRQRQNSRKKRKGGEGANAEEPPADEQVRNAPAASTAAQAQTVAHQEILPAEDPQFVNLLESVPRNLAPPADGAHASHSDSQMVMANAQGGLPLSFPQHYQMQGPQGQFILIPVPSLQTPHAPLDPAPFLAYPPHPPPPLPQPHLAPQAPPQSNSQPPSLSTRDSVDILLNLSASLGLDLPSSTSLKK